MKIKGIFENTLIYLICGISSIPILLMLHPEGMQMLKIGFIWFLPLIFLIVGYSINFAEINNQPPKQRER